MDGRAADRRLRQQPAVGLTTGDLTALVTYAMQILMAMMMLSMIFVMVIILRLLPSVSARCCRRKARCRTRHSR